VLLGGCSQIRISIIVWRHETTGFTRFIDIDADDPSITVCLKGIILNPLLQREVEDAAPTA
jgi:hypothetical protein